MKTQALLSQLRERPEEERLAIATGAALSVGVVLLLLWGLTFFVFSGSGSEAEAEIQQPTVADQQAAVTESFDSLRNQFEETSFEFQTQYEQLRRALEAEGIATEPTFQHVPVVELSLDKEGEVQVQEVLIEREEDMIR